MFWVVVGGRAFGQGFSPAGGVVARGAQVGNGVSNRLQRRAACSVEFMQEPGGNLMMPSRPRAVVCRRAES